MTWQYLIPTLDDIPQRFSLSSYATDGHLQHRLGIYCAQESHKNAPWLIGSFAPLWDMLAAGQGLYMTFQGHYAAGDGTLFSVAGAATQAIHNGNRVATHDDGTTRQDKLTDSAYSRIELRCQKCGLGHVYKTHNVQDIVKSFLLAGIQEIDLTTFNAAVNR